MKKIFSASKWLHKYFGLALILYFAWMGLSGILLNHPGLISSLAVPGFMVPPQYHAYNWSRSSITDVAFLKQDTTRVFAAGKSGIWHSRDGGRHFEPWDAGFPQAPFMRETYDLFLWEGDSSILLAATAGGLYRADPDRDRWKKIHVDGSSPNLKKIILLDEGLLLFSEDHVYRAEGWPARQLFQKVTPARQDASPSIPMIRFFFALHEGAIWGLPGKLLFDLAGLILFFLSVSAFYSWYFPWKRQRDKRRGRQKPASLMKRFFKWFLQYHLKLGIWSAAVLFIIAFTGFFMRPPLLAVLAGKSLPAAWYPAPLPENPWQHKIQNALYDPVEDKIIIAATDGFWQGPADFSQPFGKTELQTPLFVMGATVFDADSSGIMVGSFNGLYREQEKGAAFDLIAAKPAGDVSDIRLGEYMITGYFETPGGEPYILTHRQGILHADGSTIKNGRFAMPDDPRIDRMSLWKWLFELHNGRIFRDLVGSIYILIAPLGALLFMLITLSGVYDWLALRWPVLKR